MSAIQKHFTEEDRLAAIRRDKKAWSARNPEKQKAAQLKYASEHREEKNKQARERYWADIEASRARGRVAQKKTYQKHRAQCFHFSNLQPLFALENLKKKDKYGDSTS